MAHASVEDLLEDIAVSRPTNHAIVLKLREIVHQNAPGASEAIKYGGLHYTLSAPFCGIFSHAKHVSLEFSRGAEFDDGILLGDGQYRRHLRFSSPDDIDEAQVAAYVTAAYQRA
jgi:hypothetical protein